MSRGGSFGGGQSSLGYLFSSDEKQPPSSTPPPANLPPYGIDESPEEPKGGGSRDNQKLDLSNNNYHRAQGQNSGNFITDRPSTRVKSAPGGDSCLGYLFGDKK
ncbi:hypothetical protein MLD38_038635 [Melastoma candidum]|uniref:Uncharacterized protein n=1 Tax=Melastoma candidum TaxID=119954 RepID=A0ACB9L0Q6_9MYRT|nr:hypothetical protein MLD38_038635 [Melastoma candidum]